MLPPFRRGRNSIGWVYFVEKVSADRSTGRTLGYQLRGESQPTQGVAHSRRDGTISLPSRAITRVTVHAHVWHQLNQDAYFPLGTSASDPKPPDPTFPASSLVSLDTPPADGPPDLLPGAPTTVPAPTLPTGSSRGRDPAPPAAPRIARAFASLARFSLLISSLWGLSAPTGSLQT